MNEMALFGLLIVVSVVMVFYSLFSGKDGIKEQVLRRLSGKRSPKDSVLSKDKEKRSAAKEVLEKVAPIAMKPVMPKSDEEMTTLKCKLAQGGFRGESAVRYFLASKTITGLSLAILSRNSR